MAQVSCCKERWNGVKGESFEWHNNSDDDVTISPRQRCIWPFDASEAIHVKAHSKKACKLIDRQGTFEYDSDPCDRGNPKVVIIT